MRAGARWALVFFVIVVVYLSGPARGESDNFYAYATAVSLVERGTLDLADFEAPSDYRVVTPTEGLVSGYGTDRPTAPGDIARDYRLEQRDGKLLSYFPWTLSVLAIPPVVALNAGHAVGLGPGAEGLGLRGVLLVEELIGSLCAAGAAVLLGLAAGRVVADPKRRFRVGVVVAGLFAFATSAWSTVSRALDQHAPSVLLLALAMWCAAVISRSSTSKPSSAGDARDDESDDVRAERSGRATWWTRPTVVAATMGVALAWSYATRPTDALVAGALGVWLLACHRRLLVPAVAGGAIAAGLWLLVTHAEYGSWLQPYFAADRLELHDAFGEALLANLFSPARGLLVYSAAVVALGIAGVVLVWRRQSPDGQSPDGLASDGLSPRVLAALLAGAVVASWIAVSAYAQWWAGFSYGPRFLTDIVVVVVFLAAPAVDALLQLRWGSLTTPVRIVGIVVALVLAFNVFAHGQVAYFNEGNCWNGHPSIDANPDRVWDWSDPQFLAGVRSVPDLTAEDFVMGRCPSNHPDEPLAEGAVIDAREVAPAIAALFTSPVSR